jgi:Domain of unknown function (DUF4126)
MDLASTVLSAGWASGVNAYLTVALLNVLGRAGVGEVPAPLQGDGVLVAALVMYAVEFVVDKVPYLDSAWDVVHTAVRPAVGSVLGAQFAGDADVRGLDEALAAGGGGATALVSHAIKAGLRLGINASPEPLSNIVVSLVEDVLVAGVTIFAREQPEAAAAIAATLLVLGAALVVLLISRIRRALRALRARWGRGPPPA